VVEPGTTSEEGWLLSWLLLAGLGIIWGAFLIPSHRRSPASSVEEFERKMTMLAEAHNGSSGRWVLMPRKGQRFMGSHDRSRVRVRRRRRLVFTLLLEASGLTFLMGLFPPLRPMLVGTAILLGLLVVYAVALVRIRAEEIRQITTRRRTYAPAYPNGNGNGLVNGGSHVGGNGVAGSALEAGVHILDDDVHVIVRTSEELEREAILSSARSG
jgi:hypothetical protein